MHFWGYYENIDVIAGIKEESSDTSRNLRCTGMYPLMFFNKVYLDRL